MMTDTEKLTHLLKVLKNYAEQKHCYNKYGDDFNPNDYTDGDTAFEVGSEYGEITFARTLLEQIGVEYEYPWNDGGK
jgi:hypothetical protein